MIDVSTVSTCCISFIIRASVWHTHNILSFISFCLLLCLSLCDRKHMLQLFPVSGQILSILHPNTHTHKTTRNPSIHDPTSIWPSFLPFLFSPAYPFIKFCSERSWNVMFFGCGVSVAWVCYLRPDCGWCVSTRCVQSWERVGLWGSWRGGSGPGFVHCSGTWSPESRSGPWWEVLGHLTWGQDTRREGGRGTEMSGGVQ